MDLPKTNKTLPSPSSTHSNQSIETDDDLDGEQQDNVSIEPSKNDNVDKIVIIGPKGLGIRHLQVFLLFSGLLLAYAMRVNLSIGIVAMTDNSSNPDFEKYDWSEKVRGIVLSSFFWGYIISQVPGGLLAQKFGARIILLISSLVCGTLTLLTPVAASGGWQYLCAVRVLQGLAQGFIFPCVHTLLAKWVHPSERGFLTTFTYSGTQIGTVIMLALSGIIAASVFGWPGIFYISGGAELVWSILWYLYGSSSPNEYPTISRDELEFIQTIPGSSTNQKQLKTPWKSIFKSTPFWALLIAHCAQNWGFWTLLTQIPSYMKDVLNFDIKQNALLSALPYLIMWILGLGMSEMSDFLMNRGYVTVAMGRKIFNTIGLWIPMMSLIALGYVTSENTSMAVFLLTIAIAINSAAFVGYLVNHMDLSPNYAGTLMGCTNGVANIMSLLGPLFVGFIVTDATNQTLWRIVFFVAAGWFFFGNLVFIIFGQGTIQSWNGREEPLPHNNMSASTDTVETVDIAELHKGR